MLALLIQTKTKKIMHLRLIWPSILFYEPPSISIRLARLRPCTAAIFFHFFFCTITILVTFLWKILLPLDYKTQFYCVMIDSSTVNNRFVFFCWKFQQPGTDRQCVFHWAKESATRLPRCRGIRHHAPRLGITSYLCCSWNTKEAEARCCTIGSIAGASVGRDLMGAMTEVYVWGGNNGRSVTGATAVLPIYIKATTHLPPSQKIENLEIRKKKTPTQFFFFFFY